MSTFLVRGCSLSKCWKDLCPLARILPSPSLCTSLKHLGVLRKVTVQAGVTVISHMFMHLLGLILNAGRESLLSWLCCVCSGHSLKLSPAAGVKIQQPGSPVPFSRFWGVAWPLSQKWQPAHCSSAVSVLVRRTRVPSVPGPS